MKRLTYIDWLKLLSILLVITIHSFDSYVDVTQTSSFGVYISYFIYISCSIAVPLFFLINGFLTFGRKKEPLLSINKKQIIQMLVMTIFWSFMIVSVVSFKRVYLDHEKFNFLDYILRVFLFRLDGNNYLWFMIAFINLTLLKPIFEMIYNLNERYFYLIFCVIFSNIILLTGVYNIANLFIENPNDFLFNDISNNAWQLFGTYDIGPKMGLSITFYLMGAILKLNFDKVRDIKIINIFGMLTISVFLKFSYNIYIYHYLQVLYI